jgi:RimJ/RimL family protein N-acetyltransferase
MNSKRMRVRHALAHEHDVLRQLRLASLAEDPEAFGGTYARAVSQPSEWWERWAAQSELGSSQRTFVLEADDGRWMGLALVRLDDERSDAAVLNAMWVAPEARGRGAAGLLCEACAAWAASRGCRELTLTVVVENDAARRPMKRSASQCAARRRGCATGGAWTSSSWCARCSERPTHGLRRRADAVVQAEASARSDTSLAGRRCRVGGGEPVGDGMDVGRLPGQPVEFGVA